MFCKIKISQRGNTLYLHLKFKWIYFFKLNYLLTNIIFLLKYKPHKNGTQLFYNPFDYKL